MLLTVIDFPPLVILEVLTKGSLDSETEALFLLDLYLAHFLDVTVVAASVPPSFFSSPSPPPLPPLT